MNSGTVPRLPGMLPAIMIVAPNSPMLRAKARTQPLRIPGRANGSMTVQKASQRPAPRVRGGLHEAVINGCKCQANRPHEQRKTDDRRGQGRSFPIENESQTQRSFEEPAEDSLPSKCQQQQIAGDDRGQHERQD